MDDRAKVLLESGTAAIADAFDGMGETPPVLDPSLFALTESGTRFAGSAYTVDGHSHLSRDTRDQAKLAAIDAMPRDCVAVWAGNDMRGVCCFGDLLASAMRLRGCAGVVVDGGVRDTAHLRDLGLPMFARYRTPAQAVGRWRVSGSQVPVRLHGALVDWLTVQPGDIVVADDDGVIIVPTAAISEITTRISVSSRRESGARREILAGLTLLDALKRYGQL